MEKSSNRQNSKAQKTQYVGNHTYAAGLGLKGGMAMLNAHIGRI